MYEAVSEPEAETLMLRSKHGICHICHIAPSLPSLQPVQCTYISTMYCVHHGLINYIDTKAKCRHLKMLICKGTLWPVRWLSEFIEWRYSQ